MTRLSTAPFVGDPPGDTRDAYWRLSQLVDTGSLRRLHSDDDIAVLAVRGRVAGAEVIAFCTDATRMGGAVGMGECLRIANATDLAATEGIPVIGLWHSGGAKLADGVEAMDGVGRIFAATVRASGRIPQISVVLGPAAGGAAYGPALTDLVVMAPAGRVFVTGPSVVRSVTGEEIDMEGLGGAEAHGRRSGVVHLVSGSEAEAMGQARKLVELMAQPGAFTPELLDDQTDLHSLLPESPRRAYDVRGLVHALLDDRDFVELQPKWAPNVVIGLGRLAGGTVGVVANNPLRKGGCLDSLSAEKSARFVRMCDSLGIPLLVIVDVPGYLPGVRQEWDGVVRRGAKLLYAFAEAVVPRITLITRKSFGGAYIAMNSRSLGATKVFAWPDAEVAVMGAESAVEILHRRQLAAAGPEERAELRLRLLDEHRRTAGGVERGLGIGVIDEVIRPAETRHKIAAVLAGMAPTRGRHGNIPL
ncbi:carboxyl transferase domain-containing protein [Actinoallomurus sp. NPDC050550]|uniref:acyl-CoA carboxylase subunit beta n=1 Tax=Actinoallomurus sp. NPDC050550 TaxID=3154937 RepID=UPI0033CC6E67